MMNLSKIPKPKIDDLNIIVRNAIGSNIQFVISNEKYPELPPGLNQFFPIYYAQFIRNTIKDTRS